MDEMIDADEIEQVTELKQAPETVEVIRNHVVDRCAEKPKYLAKLNKNIIEIDHFIYWVEKWSVCIKQVLDIQFTK